MTVPSCCCGVVSAGVLGVGGPAAAAAAGVGLLLVELWYQQYPSFCCSAALVLCLQVCLEWVVQLLLLVQGCCWRARQGLSR
jgi:hypothetical protein